MEELELIFFIIQRGRGDLLIKHANGLYISFSVLLHGRGTVSSEILSRLGIGDPEKDVVILSVDKPRSEEVMNGLAAEMKLNEPGGGVAFMIPFSALAGQFMSYELLAGKMPDTKKEKGLKRLVNGLKRGSEEKR